MKRSSKKLKTRSSVEAKTSSFLLEVYEHCKDDEGCKLWLGLFSGHGLPQYNFSREDRVLLRNFIYNLYVQPAKKRRIIMKCGNKTCLNPDHMSGLTFSQFFSHISKGDHKSSISARIAMQKGKRGVAKLNMDIARQIRQDERLAKHVAKEYGVSISTIRGIRKNIMYVDYQNPWSQLL